VIDVLRQPMDLELFEGPLDLLLTLVLREEIDLAELALTEVVAAALGDADEGRHDAETAGELVVLLAALAELKARRLLGEPADEEPDPDALEARERLAARLVAYAPFRRAAGWLANRAAECAGPRYRRLPLPGGPPAAPPREDPGELSAALAALLVAPPQPALGHLVSRRVDLGRVLARLRDAVRRGRTVSFEAQLTGAGPLEEAVTLMAALELSRSGDATLRQPEPFGDIAITGRRSRR
jgi:segregation and condensation protein A